MVGGVVPKHNNTEATEEKRSRTEEEQEAEEILRKSKRVQESNFGSKSFERNQGR